MNVRRVRWRLVERGDARQRRVGPESAPAAFVAVRVGMQAATTGEPIPPMSPAALQRLITYGIVAMSGNDPLVPFATRLPIR
jgi:hypothetical protein